MHRCGVVEVIMQSALAIIFVLAQLSGFTAEFCETCIVEPGTKIEVYNPNGNINISKWDKDFVEVYALKKTKHGEEELDKIKIEINTDNDIIVRTKYLEKNAKVSVDYTIRIPVDIFVHRIEASNGTIELHETRGDATVISSNGDINVKDVDGYINIRTSNGDIFVKGSTRVLEAVTSNGSVDAEINTVSDNGINIITSNGSIKLRIADNLNADIAAETSNGKISIHDAQFSIDKKSKTFLKGSINDGGGLIHAATANGNIGLYCIKK